MMIFFKGKYNVLKYMGYEFQKVYARNYMQWHKNGVRIWKRGAELTLDDFTNHEGELLQYLIDCNFKPIVCHSRAFPNHSWVRFFTNHETYELTQDNTEYNKEQYGPVGEYTGNWEVKILSPEVFAELKELYEMGWIIPLDTVS